MLEELHEVDWEKLGEPDIPKWLTDMTSEDRQIRDFAFGKLMNRLNPFNASDWTVGDQELFQYALRDDIPLLVVPFLIELLKDTTLRSKRLALTMLDDLASYIYVAEVQVRPNVSEEAIYKVQAHKIREAVRQGISIYESFLDLPDSYIDSEEMIIKDTAQHLLKLLRCETIADLHSR